MDVGVKGGGGREDAQRPRRGQTCVLSTVESTGGSVSCSLATRQARVYFFSPFDVEQLSALTTCKRSLLPEDSCQGCSIPDPAPKLSIPDPAPAPKLSSRTNGTVSPPTFSIDRCPLPPSASGRSLFPLVQTKGRATPPRPLRRTNPQSITFFPHRVIRKQSSRSANRKNINFRLYVIFLDKSNEFFHTLPLPSQQSIPMGREP